MTASKYFQKDPNAFYIDKNGEWRSHSVHFSQFRFHKAREEAQKRIVSTEQIISYLNELFYQKGV